MLTFMKSLASSASGMEAQGERLRLVTENVANADTPGYKRKLAHFARDFDQTSGAETVSVSKVSLDPTAPREEFDPSHPLADEMGNVTLSNVDILQEMADAREAQLSYEANLNLFDQARKMYSGVLDLLRR